MSGSQTRQELQLQRAVPGVVAGSGRCVTTWRLNRRSFNVSVRLADAAALWYNANYSPIWTSLLLEQTLSSSPAAAHAPQAERAHTLPPTAWAVRAPP